MSAIELKRNISLTLVFFYGLGTIVGAGIYVLIGKVAGVAGIYTPFAFLLSAFVAAFTAYSYAKLAQRYPKSGGEATYVFEAFHRHRFSAIVGWLVGGFYWHDFSSYFDSWFCRLYACFYAHF